MNNAQLVCKLMKKRKYLHNWIEYDAYFFNNHIYLYLTSKDFIPDNMISLRGAKLNKNIEFHG